MMHHFESAIKHFVLKDFSALICIIQDDTQLTRT